MEIMVTVPENAAEQQALWQQAAVLHAEAIQEALEALQYPQEQKNTLRNAILRAKKEEDTPLAGGS